jgi:predicted nucleotidyltransferase
MVSRQALVKKREAYVQALDNALEAITTTLQSRPDVEKAILFGSYAEGRHER